MSKIQLFEISHPANISANDADENGYYYLSESDDPAELGRSGLARKPHKFNIFSLNSEPVTCDKICLDQGASGQGGLGLMGIFLGDWKIISDVYGTDGYMTINGQQLTRELAKTLAGQKILSVTYNVLENYLAFAFENAVLIDKSGCDWYIAHSKSCIWDI
jgi:hypothetical protein